MIRIYRNGIFIVIIVVIAVIFATFAWNSIAMSDAVSKSIVSVAVTIVPIRDKGRMVQNHSNLTGGFRL